MKNKNEKDLISKVRIRRERMQPEVLFEGIRSGDSGALSSAITLVESQKPEHRKAANELLKMCLPFTGNSIRVGITGVPGVGKSTFIEAFGQELIQRGGNLAVLAIDPSSGISGGSILGDKTRMNELSQKDEVFIRPSPAGESLGGVARKTRESIFLCEAAGYDFIVVETVGVGQSETSVRSMVDFFLLLMLAGAGDELQGIKKGIMEMADALVITKTDGDNVKAANAAAREYRNALHLFPPNANGWVPRVSTCSAIDGTNISSVLDTIDEFKRHSISNGWLQKTRIEQDKRWLMESFEDLVLSSYKDAGTFQSSVEELEDKVEKGEMTSFQAAEELYKKLREYGGV